MTTQPPDLRSDLARVLALVAKTSDYPWRAAVGWLRSASGSKIAEVGDGRDMTLEESEAIAGAMNFLSTHGQSLAALVEDAWQPIETAPNDVDILVFRDDMTMEYLAARDNDYRWQPAPHKPTAGISCPTHWRPMPPPPAARNSTGDASHE